MDEVDGNSRDHSAEYSSADTPRVFQSNDEVFTDTHELRGSSYPLDVRHCYATTTDYRENTDDECALGFSRGIQDESRHFVSCASSPGMSWRSKQQGIAELQHPYFGLCSEPDDQQVFLTSQSRAVKKEIDDRLELSQEQPGLDNSDNFIDLIPDTKQVSESRLMCSEKSDRKPVGLHASKTAAQTDPEFQSLRSESPLEDVFNKQQRRLANNLSTHCSLTGSVVQQCSDASVIENFGQFHRPSHFDDHASAACRLQYAGCGEDYYQHKLGDQDLLLHQRDREIQELKEANSRQSQFILELMDKKRQLEIAVGEQARFIMSQNMHATNQGITRQAPSQSATSGTFDQQLYETQLTMYKEDFENERREKKLIQSSVESLQEQQRTVLRELSCVREKLAATEQELQRYKNLYGPLAHQSQSYEFEGQTTSGEQFSNAANAQGRTSLYRKPGDLELDRVDLTTAKLHRQPFTGTGPSQPDVIKQIQEHPDLVKYLKYWERIIPY